MNRILSLLVVLAVSLLANAHKKDRVMRLQKLYTANERSLKFMFSEFIRNYAKQYSSPAIAESRFKNFVSNLKLSDRRNEEAVAAGGEPVHGITKFADQDEKEFREYFLGARPDMKNPANSTVERIVAPAENKAVKDGEYVNWAGVLTTPVKNQGYCGSCWAFSATEQIESDSMRTLGTDYILSPEQIVQCAPIAQGCSGGWTEVAYGYVNHAGGIEQDSAYPYSSFYGQTGGPCAAQKSEEVISVKSYTVVSGETDMTNYVLSTGPLSVCLDASNWSSYTGGILSKCGNQVDHCVQAVGVDTNSDAPYWIVRNSWGTDWGEQGYIYLAWGQNTCDITNDPTWTSVAKTSTR